jgi:hypothetical protein
MRRFKLNNFVDQIGCYTSSNVHRVNLHENMTFPKVTGALIDLRTYG